MSFSVLSEYPCQPQGTHSITRTVHMVALAIFLAYITYSLPRSQAQLLGLSPASFLSVRRKEPGHSKARSLVSVTQPTERISILFAAAGVSTGPSLLAIPLVPYSISGHG
ncbi:hypothetical protein F5883DRAFT_132190 [Diaporthe sp. PMI_573]|nr:hypothetical protein F5883DRAFT_132190 [Diaporthaceae sp. PMI_573]